MGGGSADGALGVRGGGAPGGLLEDLRRLVRAADGLGGHHSVHGPLRRRRGAAAGEPGARQAEIEAHAAEPHSGDSPWLITSGAVPGRRLSQQTAREGSFTETGSGGLSPPRGRGGRRVPTSARRWSARRLRRPALGERPPGRRQAAVIPDASVGGGGGNGGGSAGGNMAAERSKHACRRRPLSADGSTP